MNIGDKIKYKRESLNMSQEELAKKVGYSGRSTIARIESGSNDVPRKKLDEFAKALNTTVYYLMGEQDERKDLNVQENPDMTTIIEVSKKIPPDKLKALAEFVKKTYD